MAEVLKDVRHLAAMRAIITVIVLLAVHTVAETCGTNSPNAADFARGKYDYIIIGGGTAGLAIANRLSEDSKTNVGVIEAGLLRLNDPLVDVPGLSGQALGNALYDWKFLSTPQDHAGGRVVAQPRGKMTGGSSGLNLLAWDRGVQQDYDSWGKLSNTNEWTWGDLLPYLKKVESTAIKPSDPFPGASQSKPSSETHGFSGPINATLNALYAGEIDPYVRSWNALNASTISDPYSGKKNGVYNARTAVDQRFGKRSYAATGYYCPVSGRPNLHLLTNAQATKIIFSDRPDSKGLYTARSVEYNVGDELFSANASKEIILSAGTVQSPQLLELSGIGNQALLSELGISTLVDLPGVGENLQDHIFAPTQSQVVPGVRTFDELRNNATFETEQEELYNTSHTGLLATTDSALAFLPIQSFTEAKEFKSLLSRLEASLKNMTLSPLQKAQYDIQMDWLQSGNVPQIEVFVFSRGLSVQPNTSYYSALGGILHPFSRGSIHINSSNPLASPVIDPQYLSIDFDLELLALAAQLTVRHSQTLPLSNIVAANILPGPDVKSTEDYQSYAQSSFMSGSHIAGTSAMAPRSLGGVVDTNLKVYGTSNLRVVDASIMPILLAAHLQATTYAIGEKAADIIRGYWDLDIAV